MKIYLELQLYEFHQMYYKILDKTTNQSITLNVIIIIYKTTQPLTLDHVMLFFIHPVMLTSGAYYIYLSIIIYYKYNFLKIKTPDFFSLKSSISIRTQK